MAPAALNKKSGGKAKAAKSTKSHRFDPIPKRVTQKFRIPFSYFEWTRLVEEWYSAKIQGYPEKETIVGLADRFGRCVKQINTFYTNRRQDVSRKQAEGSLTEEELYELLWAKYTGTSEERMIAKRKGLPVREALSSSSCGSSTSSSKLSSTKSSSPTPSLTVSEGSGTDSTNSEASVEPTSSAELPVVDSGCSQWLSMVTPAMAALLQVVDEKLSELEVTSDEPVPSL